MFTVSARHWFAVGNLLRPPGDLTMFINRLLVYMLSVMLVNSEDVAGSSTQWALDRTSSFHYSFGGYSPASSPLSTNPYFAGFFEIRPAAIIIGT